MKNRCEEGAMCALFPIKSVDLALEIAEKANCEIACYNSPTQVVLGGTVVQISKVMELARSAKIRRVIPLKVSTAFHTRLMLPALEEFTKILESTPMESLSPTSPEIISTITGNSLNHSTPSQIRSLLASQLCSPVLFSQAISRAISAFQLSEIIHIGPGTSLTGSISEHLKLSQSSPTYKTIDTPTQIH
jgi:[acyl-carrier-protein] S-malonyltransferase